MKPRLPKGIQKTRLFHLPYRAMMLDIVVEGHGAEITEFRINDRLVATPFLPATETGDQRIAVTVG
jgi:hypothetical protein